MPKGSSQARYENIRREGAQVTIEDVNYDDCVRMAAAEAAETSMAWWCRIPPGRSMRRSPPGSCRATAPWPMRRRNSCGRWASTSHPRVRPGGRGLSGRRGDRLLHEPVPQRSPEVRGDGGPGRRTACTRAPWPGRSAPDRGGDLKTIMAGLACGEPNILSWDILRNHVSAFLSCPDWVSAVGCGCWRAGEGRPHGDLRRVRRCGHGRHRRPDGDRRIRDLREAIGLDRFSQVLLFSTEGNTDPMKFRKVLWDGEYPTI